MDMADRVGLRLIATIYGPNGLNAGDNHDINV